MRSALRPWLLPLVCALAVPFSSLGAAPEVPDYSTLSSIVAQALEAGHYSRHPLDAEMSARFLSAYLDALDGDHLYFTRQDIDAITQAHAATLGSDALNGNLQAALEIYDLYKKRMAARIDWIDAQLKDPHFDFTGNDTVELSREKSPWPMDGTEADLLWKKEIAGEVLDEVLTGATMEKAVQSLQKRYRELRDEMSEHDKGDTVALFLNALAGAYDPHSEYLRKEDVEDLDTDMQLSMVGIGIVVEAAPPYVRIVSLLPGSPAAVDGRLKVNDRITAVARDDGKYVDVAGMSIDKVLNLIRGKAGARIRLRVIPAKGADEAARQDVDLVTRSIDLVDEQANAQVVEHVTGDGSVEKLGWIKIPSFYGDPEHPHGKSVARDVRNLVMRLKERGVSGIVLDLRGNPGGELEEAVAVGGIFLGRVPIVQEREGNGSVHVSKSAGRMLYGGPLVVMTDHMTASAAELLSSALQDYGRAVIVGGHTPTYGKGSVQTIVDVAELLEANGQKPGQNDLGALQLTIAKFYRVNGQSTQLRGLKADIELPSPEDLPLEGESSNKNTMVYDEIKPVLKPVEGSEPAVPLAMLKEFSLKRQAADKDFQYLSEDLDRTRKKDEANVLSLNETTRRAEMAENKAREKIREEERKLRPANADKITPVMVIQFPSAKGMKPGDASETVSAKPTDPAKTEALNILSDLVRWKQSKTAPQQHFAEYSTTGLDRGMKAP